MKKLLSLGISGGFLAILYSYLDVGAIGTVLVNVNWHWLGPAFVLFVLLTIMPAFRLTWLTPGEHGLSVGESLRLILSAAVFNMITPSRMGDLIKAYFMTLRTGMRGSTALSISVFEKSVDMIGLLFWCVTGLAFYGTGDLFYWAALIVTLSVLAILVALVFAGKKFLGLLRPILPSGLIHRFEPFVEAWAGVHNHMHDNPARFYGIVLYSVALWFLHLVQLWMFIMALGSPVPFGAAVGLLPLGLLAGLVPLTFAGVGTRDAALVFLFAPWLSTETAAALGLLATSRYILPAIAGAPFVGPYMNIGIEKLRDWRNGVKADQSV